MTYFFEDAEIPTRAKSGRAREATPFDEILATMELGKAKKFTCAEKDFDDVRKLLRSAARHAKRAVKIYSTPILKGQISITFVAYEPTVRQKKETAETNVSADTDTAAETNVSDNKE